MKKRLIPFFDYPALFASRKKEFMRVIEDVCSRGAYIMQRDLIEFEQHLASYLGVKHAVGVANCTDGLILALRAAGVPAGCQVIFPSHTMVATPSAVYFAGAIPVPVDCGRDHLMDSKSAEAAITSETRAIIPVQLNGRTCNMDAILGIAERHGLMVIEDAAQSLGSTFKGKFAGTFGKAAAFSFYPAKILGCFGDGGAVVTNDDAIAEKLKLLRDHGRADDGEVVLWGVNSRLANLQAAILDYQFKFFAQTIQRRREVASIYQSSLRDLPQIHLPPAPDSDPDHFDVYQNYEIEAERRDDLRAFLKEHGIGTLIQWGGKAVHQFKALDFHVNLPYTDQMFTRCLMLPMHHMLADEDVTYVCETIRNFYGA